jgi:hypothetical protein
MASFILRFHLLWNACCVLYMSFYDVQITKFLGNFDINLHTTLQVHLLFFILKIHPSFIVT